MAILVNAFQGYGVVYTQGGFMHKVLIAGAVALASLTAQADPYYYHGHGPHIQYRYVDRGSDWVAPAILGGLVVYAATRPPVVVQQPPVVVAPTCGPWVEIRNADGTVTQTRTCQ